MYKATHVPEQQHQDARKTAALCLAGSEYMKHSVVAPSATKPAALKLKQKLRTGCVHTTHAHHHHVIHSSLSINTISPASPRGRGGRIDNYSIVFTTIT